MNFSDLELRLRQHAPPIIVVEDYLPALTTISAWAEAYSGFVASFVGLELDPNGPALLTCSPGAAPQPLQLPPNSLVLLDHYFASRTLNGTLATPRLVALGATVVGISSSPSANDAMVRLGAWGSLTKRDLLDGIRRNSPA